MDVIRLNRMVFYGYHGVSAPEKETGRRFEVDCELEVDLAAPGQSDQLTDTVDYVAIYDMIRTIVEGKAFALIEKLALAIADNLLEAFPIFAVTVRVRKMIPPIPGNIDNIEIEVSRKQPDTSKIISDNKE